MVVLKRLSIAVALLLPATAQGGVEDGVLALNNRDFQAALAELTPAAENNHPFAQQALGDMYAAGLGVARDMKQACGWWERAALNGRAEAMHNLGTCYALGQGGLIPDPAKALSYYGMAAEAGLADAWCAMGEIYLTVESEHYAAEKGVELCLKGAEAGAARAQFTVAGLYMTGKHGVEKDYAKAADWFSRAAAQGDLKATYTLALMYRDGLGVERDIRRAGQLLETAATKGHLLAQFNLGELLFVAGIDPEAKTFDGPRLVNGYYWMRLAFERLDIPKYRDRAADVLATLAELLPGDVVDKLDRGLIEELGIDALKEIPAPAE